VGAGKVRLGGDGLVVARLLKQKHIPCEVVLLTKRDELSPDAARNYKEFLKVRGKAVEATEGGLDRLAERLSGKGLLVGAILGTGIKSSSRRRWIGRGTVTETKAHSVRSRPAHETRRTFSGCRAQLQRVSQG